MPPVGMLARTALSLLRHRCASRAGQAAAAIPTPTPTTTTSCTFTRPLSILTPHRPTTLLCVHAALPPPPEHTVTPGPERLDLLPRISASPALRFLQLRNGPRDTFDPSHFVRKRRFGFLARLRSRTGRAILKRRRAKGRKSLSH
ncbi:ribosomal protein L34-domain-containing protein [Tirmania nivea]|nr:ribosomal protein L34-domain-containing protein [Tirmania nivea]